MYGLNDKEMLSENDEFIPNSPYAEGKHHIHKKIIEINKNKGLDIKSGIMFNHGQNLELMIIFYEDY